MYSLKESVGFQLRKVIVIRLLIFDQRHYLSFSWRIMPSYVEQFLHTKYVPSVC